MAFARIVTFSGNFRGGKVPLKRFGGSRPPVAECRVPGTGEKDGGRTALAATNAPAIASEIGDPLRNYFDYNGLRHHSPPSRKSFGNINL